MEGRLRVAEYPGRSSAWWTEVSGKSRTAKGVPLRQGSDVCRGRRGVALVQYCASLAPPRMSSAYLLLMLTKWAQSSRLETRTKEFSICASIWVRKTHVRNESEGWFGQLRWEDGVTNAVCTIDRSGDTSKDLSKSTSAGTRKMVNYAWIG